MTTDEILTEADAIASKLMVSKYKRADSILIISMVMHMVTAHCVYNFIKQEEEKERKYSIDRMENEQD